MDDEKAARKTVRERSGGICEKCGAARATDFSHRKARSQQGKWSASNAIDACRSCHQWHHLHPDVAYGSGFFVPGHEDPAQIPARLRYGLVLLHDDGTVTPVRRDPDLPDDLTAVLAALEGPR